MGILSEYFAEQGEGGQTWLARMKGAEAKYGSILDKLQAKYGGKSGWREAFTLGMAQVGPPPNKGASSAAYSEWTSRVMKAGYIMAHAAQERARARAYGADSMSDPKVTQAIASNQTPEAARLLDDKIQSEFGTMLTGESDQLGELDSLAQSLSDSEVDAQGSDGNWWDSPKESEAGGDYESRLAEFRKALYNQGTARRLGDIAGEQAARGSYAAGVRGTAATQGLSRAGADAAFQYESNINQQAMNLMGLENNRELGAAQLQLQADQFNAQQRQLAAQNAYNQRAGLGGTIGGVAGGIVGGIIQGYTGAPVAGAFTSAGTALGSLAGGQAPGGQYASGGNSLSKKSSGGTNNTGV